MNCLLLHRLLPVPVAEQRWQNHGQDQLGVDTGLVMKTEEVLEPSSDPPQNTEQHRHDQDHLGSDNAYVMKPLVQILKFVKYFFEIITLFFGGLILHKKTGIFACFLYFVKISVLWLSNN